MLRLSWERFILVTKKNLLTMKTAKCTQGTQEVIASFIQVIIRNKLAFSQSRQSLGFENTENMV
jgi:hypothetical protein